MTGRNLRVLRRGRPMPGFGVCHRCRTLTDNTDAVMVARPGASRGVWWCAMCVANLTEVSYSRGAAAYVTDRQEETMPDIVDPNTHQGPVALPGPHPHEADGVRQWAGTDPSLPEGVERGAWQTGDTGPDRPATTEH